MEVDLLQGQFRRSGGAESDINDHNDLTFIIEGASQLSTMNVLLPVHAQIQSNQASLTRPASASRLERDRDTSDGDEST